MWKIGDTEIHGQVVLGPMAGITTAAYREFMRPFGIALAYTEMISDCGLIYGNEETFSYLKKGKGDRPLALQLFGGSKETLLQAIEILEQSGAEYDFLDINLGCPVPKVTRAGSGSAWLKRLDELAEMMRAVTEKSSRPVTAKIRLGWDDSSINFHETIKVLEKSNVKMVALHLRTRSALYSGDVDYHIAENLQLQMKIPLVISGDIFTYEKAKEALDITKATAVMVARGALGNPGLIRQINQIIEDKKVDSPVSLKTQIEYMRVFSRLLIEEKGELVAVRQLRGLLPKFLNGYPGMKPYKAMIVNSIICFKDIEAILEQISKSS